ncbi:MAG: hypothetical protein C5B49_02025 [Bdellovibrio sp.]|nr:MAG: hypothetical protein C5B49_02025 [Bdellovibrio sp.]
MATIVIFGQFEWDGDKAQENIRKHDVDFYTATLAFFDPNRIIAIDEGHSLVEERLFCVGRIGRKVATVRFTRRGKRIRIFGAGFWRAGRKLYGEERKNKRPE